MIFDSHAHYDSDAFNDDRDRLLGEILPSKNVGGIINCATDYRTMEISKNLAQRFDYIYFAAGVHPEEIPENEDINFDIIEEYARHPKCVAVGEIGLEYHYDDIAPRDVQKKWFEEQVILANQLDMPVIVHDRDAHSDTMEILKKHKPRGVVHCFSGSVEMAKEVIKLGMYIGLGGAVTFKNARVPVEVARFVPLDRLLLETDCPYMAPTPFRGKRNDSSLIQFIAEKIGEVKGIGVDKLTEICRGNAKKLFGIE